MKNKKGFIIPIVIILALIILAIIAYFFSPKSISTTNVKIPSPSPVASPDPTANWKTYTNSKYNFSILYPVNSEIDELSNSGKTDSSNVSFNHWDTSDPDNIFRYTMFVVDNNSNETSEQFGNISLSDLIGMFSSMTIFEKGIKSINNASVYYAVVRDGNNDNIFYYYTNPNFKYTLSMPYTSNFQKDFANKTFSTIKFQ